MVCSPICVSSDSNQNSEADGSESVRDGNSDGLWMDLGHFVYGQVPVGVHGDNGDERECGPSLFQFVLSSNCTHYI